MNFKGLQYGLVLMLGITMAPAQAGNSENVVASTPNVDVGSHSATVLDKAFRNSIQAMVQAVRDEKNPQEKRDILASYFLNMEQGLEKVKSNPTLTLQDRMAVSQIQKQFNEKYSEYTFGNGVLDLRDLSDSDLNAFAGHIQQQWEQANNWGGGVYLSGGALLLILILVLIFR